MKAFIVKQQDNWLKIRVQCPESEVEQITQIRSCYIGSYDYYISSFSKMGGTWFLDISAQMMFKPDSGSDNKSVEIIQEQFFQAHGIRLES